MSKNIILYGRVKPSSERIIRFGGMSGGPIFKIMSEYDYSFSGIIYEGRGFHEGKNTEPTDEIWIYGLLFGPEQLDLAFKLFKPKLKIGF